MQRPNLGLQINERVVIAIFKVHVVHAADEEDIWSGRSSRRDLLLGHPQSGKQQGSKCYSARSHGPTIAIGQPDSHDRHHNCFRTLTLACHSCCTQPSRL